MYALIIALFTTQLIRVVSKAFNRQTDEILKVLLPVLILAIIFLLVLYILKYSLTGFIAA